MNDVFFTKTLVGSTAASPAFLATCSFQSETAPWPPLISSAPSLGLLRHIQTTNFPTFLNQNNKKLFPFVFN